jgi:hypothetical protein
MRFLGNGALKKSDIYVQVFTFKHSNFGAKMVGCGAIFPLGHQFQQSLDCVCTGTTFSDLVQPLAHGLFGLAANLIANSYG